MVQPANISDLAKVSWSVIHDLGERDLLILRKRTFSADGPTLEEIGEEFGGITRERVRQLEQKALTRMETEFERKIEKTDSGSEAIVGVLSQIEREVGKAFPHASLPEIPTFVTMTANTVTTGAVTPDIWRLRDGTKNDALDLVRHFVMWFIGYEFISSATGEEWHRDRGPLQRGSCATRREGHDRLLGGARPAHEARRRRAGGGPSPA